MGVVSFPVEKVVKKIKKVLYKLISSDTNKNLFFTKSPTISQFVSLVLIGKPYRVYRDRLSLWSGGGYLFPDNFHDFFFWLVNRLLSCNLQKKFEWIFAFILLVVNRFFSSNRLPPPPHISVVFNRLTSTRFGVSVSISTVGGGGCHVTLNNGGQLLCGFLSASETYAHRYYILLING